MNRIEIEVKLTKDRARRLEILAGMSEAELAAPRTRSEHDPSKMWSYSDHFIHTTLIEKNWNEMFRRHIAGEAGLPPRLNADGTRQSREEIMAGIHGWTEAWADDNRGKSLDELVRIGLSVRSDTLKLLSELSDEQLDSKIPGAPWADGTVGAIMAANADHAGMHFKWAAEGVADDS
ncbi:MAG: DinB family protein [Acidimicrobiales bacterium]